MNPFFEDEIQIRPSEVWLSPGLETMDVLHSYPRALDLFRDDWYLANFEILKTLYDAISSLNHRYIGNIRTGLHPLFEISPRDACALIHDLQSAPQVDQVLRGTYPTHELRSRQVLSLEDYQRSAAQELGRIHGNASTISSSHAIDYPLLHVAREFGNRLEHTCIFLVDSHFDAEELGVSERSPTKSNVTRLFLEEGVGGMVTMGVGQTEATRLVEGMYLQNGETRVPLDGHSRAPRSLVLLL